MKSFFIFGAIYLVGCYGAAFINLLFRKVIVKNYRNAGMLLLFISTVVGSYLISSNVPPDTSSSVVGEIFGELIFGPVLLLIVCVGIKMWIENGRKTDL